MYAIGKVFLDILPYVAIKNRIIKGLTALGLGFFIFMSGVFILAAFNFYTKEAIMLFILLSTAISFRILKEIFRKIFKPFISYDLKNPSDTLALIINEAHLLLITLLLSVNFLNVYRPFPIGWDDLGVYMNYPKILAQS